MKKSLLLLSVFGAFTCFSQKKITSYSDRQFNESGNLTATDSTAYVYSTWEGSINYNGPILGTNNGSSVYLWNWEAPEVNFTTSTSFMNGIQNMTNTKVYNSNFQVTSNTSTTNYRELYTYTSSGKVATYRYENDNAGSWVFSNGKNYTYDSSDRLVISNTTNSISGVETVTQIDSIAYVATTMNISSVSSNSSSDGITFYPSELIMYTYTGDVVNTLQYYGDDDNDNTTPLVYFVSATYNYTAGNLTSFVGYLVSSGVVTSQVAIQVDYTYNSSNLLLTDNQTGMFGLMGHNYTYDAEGFVTKVENLYEINAGGSLYTAQDEYFYYQSTASLNEMSEIEFNVYPNPTSEVVNISSSNSINSMILFSLDGKKLISQSNGTSINISHLPQGNYFLEVQTSKGASRKMISKN